MEAISPPGKMQRGSVLASEDVDWSFAFIHLVTAFGVKPSS
jgi:hypothetical protein